MTTENSQPNGSTVKNILDEIPEVIVRLLSKPPVLPNESEDEFWDIFQSFISAIPPCTVLDYYICFDVTVLTFEVIRYRRMKIAILKNLERPVVESFFRKTHQGAAMKDAWQAVAVEASQRANKWMLDANYRKTASKTFELAGYGQDALEADAFVRALPDISSIERLIVSAQRRLNAFLKELTNRHDNRVATMRAMATRAVEKS